MARAEYSGPADRLDAYEELVGSFPDVERKGAANPYTSRNSEESAKSGRLSATRSVSLL
jgi:hypothetical protein